MDKNIIEQKQRYVDLLIRRDHSVTGHVSRRSKRFHLQELTYDAAHSRVAPPEIRFISAVLSLQTGGYSDNRNPVASPPKALKWLHDAYAAGHLEAGLALCSIHDGDYPAVAPDAVEPGVAQEALGRGIAAGHPYAHFLKARDGGRLTPGGAKGGPPVFKDETAALSHLEKIKQADYLPAFYLEACWLVNGGPGSNSSSNSNTLAAQILEDALARKAVIDFLAADLLADIYCLLGEIYSRATVAEDRKRAHGCFTTALGYDQLRARQAMMRCDHALDDFASGGSGPGGDGQSPLRFFADPEAEKNVYFNDKPPSQRYGQPFNFHNTSSSSPLIEDLGNGYALISSPENRDHKPAIRVRIHYPDKAHVAMRDRIAGMDTLDQSVIDEMMQPLNVMPGLADIKKNLNGLIHLAYVMKRRKDLGLRTRDPGLHMVFSGNPGTGKTHVARLAGQILYQIGFLENGHVIEAHKSDLTGEYIGWSESKTNLLCQASFGGLLFIDEAYTLSDSPYGGDFGYEVITTLLKMMEDFSDRFVVIAAGYKEKMEEFLRANPGLRSRFGQTIHFRNYTPEEMGEIFALFARDHDYTLGNGTQEKVTALLKSLKGVEYDRFGNARGVRNLFDSTIRLQSARIVREGAMDAKSLSLILPQDIPNEKPISNGNGVSFFPTDK